jgi:5-methylcytosine-specific restriction endonuclease McrA
MKVCITCRKKFALTEFYKSKAGYYHSYCKKCDILRRKVDLRKGRGNSIAWIVRLLVTKYRNVKPISLSHRKRMAMKLLERLYKTPNCPFTGVKLIPGKNIHLDHKIPRSRRPDLAYKLSNLQWVSDKYNKAKGTMTDKQFLKFCKTVLEHRTSRTH